MGGPEQRLRKGKEDIRLCSGAAAGRLLHGTLLVSCDLAAMRSLLKPSGRSRTAPVTNLAETVPGSEVERIEELLSEAIVLRAEVE